MTTVEIMKMCLVMEYNEKWFLLFSVSNLNFDISIHIFLLMSHIAKYGLQNMFNLRSIRKRP